MCTILHHIRRPITLSECMPPKIPKTLLAKINVKLTLHIAGELHGEVPQTSCQTCIQRCVQKIYGMSV